MLNNNYFLALFVFLTKYRLYSVSFFTNFFNNRGFPASTILSKIRKITTHCKSLYVTTSYGDFFFVKFFLLNILRDGLGMPSRWY